MQVAMFTQNRKLTMSPFKDGKLLARTNRSISQLAKSVAAR
jgi:hypothetical protein